MVQDIRLAGYDFLGGPFLPMAMQRQFHLFYIFDGSGVLIMDSSSYTYSRDNLSLFPSLEVVIPAPTSRSSLTTPYITFTYASPDMDKEFTLLPRLLPFSAENRSLLMEILYEYILKRPTYKDPCSLYLEQLLIPLTVAAYRECQTGPHFPRTSRQPEGPLSEARLYIDRHLSEGLSSDILCETCRINAHQLNSLFKKTFHQSTVKYIGNRRLARTRELLCFSQLSITQTAEYTGFKSVRYSSRVFKEKEGIPPGGYRKRIARSLTLWLSHPQNHFIRTITGVNT